LRRDAEKIPKNGQFFWELPKERVFFAAHPWSSPLEINDLRIGSKGRTRTVKPDSDTRRMRFFPLKIKKNSPEFVTIFHYFSILSLTVAIAKQP
jgi:hypothetical protein